MGGWMDGWPEWGAGRGEGTKDAMVVERAMVRSRGTVVCVRVCGMRNGRLDWQ